MRNSVRANILFIWIVISGIFLTQVTANGEISPDGQWEKVHTNSESYSLLLQYIDGALYHGSNQLSSKPGLWKSTDNGANWERVWRQGGSAVFAMASNDSYQFLTTSAGIYRFDRNGEEWTKTSSSLKGQSTGMSIISLGDVIIAGSQNGKIQRSTDNGENWKNVHNTFSDTALFGTSLQMISSIILHKGELFLSSSLKGVARSSDKGKNWESARGDLPVGSAPALLIANDLVSTPNKLYGAVNNKVYSTANKGETWTLELDGNYKGLIGWNGQVLAYGDGGIKLKPSDEDEWIDITNNLTIPDDINFAQMAASNDYIWVPIEAGDDFELWRRPVEGTSGILKNKPGFFGSKTLHNQNPGPVYDLKGRKNYQLILLEANGNTPLGAKIDLGKKE